MSHILTINNSIILLWQSWKNWFMKFWFELIVWLDKRYYYKYLVKTYQLKKIKVIKVSATSLVIQVFKKLVMVETWSIKGPFIPIKDWKCKHIWFVLMKCLLIVCKLLQVSLFMFLRLYLILYLLPYNVFYYPIYLNQTKIKNYWC